MHIIVRFSRCVHVYALHIFAGEVFAKAETWKQMNVHHGSHTFNGHPPTLLCGASQLAAENCDIFDFEPGGRGFEAARARIWLHCGSPDLTDGGG